MTEREARIKAIRRAYQESPWDVGSAEVRSLLDIVDTLQAAERDRDAAQRGLACALRWLRDNDCGDVADVIEADFTPTPPPEEDAR